MNSVSYICFAQACSNNKEVFEREWQWMRKAEGRREVEITLNLILINAIF